MQIHRPKILFLSETRKNKVFVEGLRWRLGLKHVVTFTEKGKGGGLALFWHESVDVQLFKLDRRLIDVTVHDLPVGIKWRCTFVYGEPRTHERYNMWNLLKRIKPLLPGPWLMLGDFNECMWQQEHFSASRRGDKQMSDFRETLSFCDLFDLGFKGRPWTFDNKQEGRRNVRVRLDRAVASTDWSNLFPNNQVMHLTSSRSDHCPILLSLDNYGAVTRSKPMRRYEVFWEREASLGQEIEQAWSMHKKPNCLGEVANNLRGGMDSREIEIIADLKGKQPMLVQMNVNSEKQSKAKNHWTKSLEGWAKLNFAAGFNEQSNSGS
jgi:exonuclease III